VWRPGRYGADRDVTVMVDLTRGADGRLRSRLLDALPGRSGTAYKTWLDTQTEEFRSGVKHAALDPFRGYANALRDGLSDAVAVLDAFHVTWAPRSLTRSAAASNNTPCTGAGTATTRSTRSAGCSGTGWRT